MTDQDEFGGVAVEDTADEFGGVPVMDAPEPTEADAESILAGPEGEPAWVGPNGQRPNEAALLPYNPSAWESFRNTRIGHSVFGPTDVEQQSELKPYNDPGLLPIARTMLKFSSPPPPVAEEIRTLTDPVLESPFLGQTWQGVAKGLRETAVNLPIAPFGPAGEMAMPLFAGEFAASVPEQKAEYEKALREGRTADAARIATEFAAGGALIAAGTKHEMGRTLDRFAPKEISNVEPKTETATPGTATEAGAETETQTFVGDKPVEVLEINRQKKIALVRDANDPEAAPDVVKLSDLEEREVTKGGDNTASSEQEAATVYGDLQPRTGESPGEVPTEKGSEGILTQADRGIQPAAEGKDSEVSLSDPNASPEDKLRIGKNVVDRVFEMTPDQFEEWNAELKKQTKGGAFTDSVSYPIGEAIARTGNIKFLAVLKEKAAAAAAKMQKVFTDSMAQAKDVPAGEARDAILNQAGKFSSYPQFFNEIIQRAEWLISDGKAHANRFRYPEDIAALEKFRAEQSGRVLPLSEFTGEVPDTHVPIKVQRPDGTIYEAYLVAPPGSKMAGTRIAKVKADTRGLSDGILGKGDKIIEGPKTAEEYDAARQKAQNLPEWTRKEMVKRGIDPNRTFNDVDLANPSVREAIQSDPTLSAAEKERLLSTGSLKEPEVSVGPGGASPSDVGSEKSDMQALTQAIEGTASPKESISDRLTKAKEAVANLPGVGKNAIKRGLLRIQGIASAIKSGLTTLPKFTTYKRILGQWNGANQIADHELRQFVKTIDRTIPQPKQEAMVNWIQADGNADVLRQRATDSNPKFRKGYEDALKLTKDEQTAARNISSYLDARLQSGIDAGLLQDGVEQYITQIWKRENPISRKLSGDFSTAKLQPNFKFARQRIFDSYFEGEQAGYEPANKTVSAVIAAYDQSFNRALASRAFVKNLTEGKASDGRPLVEVSGTGSAVPRGEAPEAILINPKIKGADLADYRTIDHPALRKWAWQTQAPDGTPVFLKGDLLVHPEIYQHLKNVLGTSAWRKNIVGRAVLGTESTLKQAMFSLSGFHQVQETLHALGHRVNPARLERINFSEPWQKEAVEHGLQVADYNALEKFGEGLNSGALINKIPLLGTKVMGPYTEWLFQDYIPRLKLTMYREALARNMNRYAKQLESGKITRDQIVENTAKQANAAFGELNYTWLGRNKTLQDTMRAFLVAPDFLEARSKFVGQAVRSHGREQLVALGILAATQYLTARIVNKINDDDPHWELKNAFSLVKGKHRYELRTIPGDLIHLIEDPHRFTTSRLAPIVRQAIEFVEGRDWRGVKRDAGEQIKDLAKVAVPISLKPYEGQRLWEAALNAFGVHETRYTAQDQIREKAQAFVKEHKGTQHQPEPTDEPTYGKLRAAVSNGNQSHAKDLLNELLKAHGPQRVFDTMESHVLRPFTESRLNEADFRNSLSEKDKALYDKARDERREEFRKFLELWYKR